MDMSYSELRQNLKFAIDQVSDRHEPIVITSNKKRKAILVSYEDYHSLEETAYLLRSPANIKRLMEAVADVKSGKVTKHGLVDDET